jgi:hypothetical protein
MLWTCVECLGRVIKYGWHGFPGVYVYCRTSHSREKAQYVEPYYLPHTKTIVNLEQDLLPIFDGDLHFVGW